MPPLSTSLPRPLRCNCLDLSRLGNRRELLTALGRYQQEVESEGIDNFQRQAFGMLKSSRLAEALDLENEPRAMRDRYGETQKTDPSFGGAPQSPQHLLLTRRLIEAGVRCVSVAFGAWDWHANREGTIEYLSKKYLPVFDHALSVFLEDLDDRGLLETTTVNRSGNSSLRHEGGSLTHLQFVECALYSRPKQTIQTSS